MNKIKMQAMEDQQTGIAKKVLNCVPKTDAWSLVQIMNEFARTVGNCPEKNRVMGCLKSLVDTGLVEEVKGWPVTYRRTKAHENPPPPAAAVLQQDQTQAQEQKPDDPLTRIGAITMKLRGMCDEIDDAALLLQQEVAKAAQDGKESREFRAYLKRFVAENG